MPPFCKPPCQRYLRQPLHLFTHPSIRDYDHFRGTCVLLRWGGSIQEAGHVRDDNRNMPTEFTSLLLLSPVDNIPQSKDRWVVEQLQGWLDLDKALSIQSIFTKGSHIIAIRADTASRYLCIMAVSWLMRRHIVRTYQ